MKYVSICLTKIVFKKWPYQEVSSDCSFRLPILWTESDTMIVLLSFESIVWTPYYTRVCNGSETFFFNRIYISLCYKTYSYDRSRCHTLLSMCLM